MPNIMDYLDWRGDLTMSVSPFNEVDNLILAQVSYINFKNIVHGIESEDSISVKEAAALFCEIHSGLEVKSWTSIVKVSVELLKKMARCPRFSDLKLSKYVDTIDYEEEKQFSAINIALEDGTVYVAYRGTDDTIIGWKEDFNMSFMPIVPAQIEAVKYLMDTAGKASRKIRIGGHSKGGNLAVFAAMKCPSYIKENIIEIYNNDGPGFDREIISSKEYKEIRDKIKTIVPQTSIVGMLMEHEEEYSVVKSNQKHIMQHYAMSWEVLGKQFVHVDSVTKESRMLDIILKAWVDKMGAAQRERFVDSMFCLLEALGIKSIKDLTNNKLRRMTQIGKIISSMPAENKEVLTKAIKLILMEGGKVLRYGNKQNEISSYARADSKKVIKYLPIMRKNRINNSAS